MMRPQRSYGTRALSRPKATAAATQLLYGCTLERLRALTAEELVRLFNIAPGDAANMLARAKAVRR